MHSQECKYRMTCVGNCTCEWARRCRGQSQAETGPWRVIGALFGFMRWLTWTEVDTCSIFQLPLPLPLTVADFHILSMGAKKETSCGGGSKYL